jgi:hypothetical protein
MYPENKMKSTWQNGGGETRQHLRTSKSTRVKTPTRNTTINTGQEVHPEIKCATSPPHDVGCV